MPLNTKIQQSGNDMQYYMKYSISQAATLMQKYKFTSYNTRAITCFS